MVFGLPRVEWADRVVVGKCLLGACYDADLNLIQFSMSWGGSTWFRLIHELGHWVLCLLPRCDFVYNLNLGYDYYWRWLFQREEERVL